MDLLNGVFNLLFIKSGSFWVPIGCLSSNDFSESVEMLPTTTRDNPDGWETSIPTSQKYNISFSGLVKLSNDDGSILTYYELKVLKRSRTQIEWKIENSKGGIVESGLGYIQSLGDSSNIDEFVSFNGDIIGFGPPTTEESSIVFFSDVFESDVFE